ncbi:MAG TPA: hypothetical protein VK191_11225 [Symbiobacteriaceae bacterium]|nr:hypothetical protein [Symbiobacteriaceae bacterium]
MSQDVGRRKRKCERVSPAMEIPVGTINIDCSPVRFETETEVETIVACCVNGFRRPGIRVPFDPTPFIRPVPSKFGPSEFFSTNMEQISTSM